MNEYFCGEATTAQPIIPSEYSEYIYISNAFFGKRNQTLQNKEHVDVIKITRSMRPCCEEHMAFFHSGCCASVV